MEYLHSQVYQFGKHFQDCQAAAEELFRAERVLRWILQEGGILLGGYLTVKNLW